MPAAARGRPTGGTEKIWKDAVRLAVMRKDEDKRTVLAHLAERLVTAALDGDVSALKEVGDRLDGKVPQAIVGSDDHPPVLPIGKFNLVPVVAK